MANYFTSPADLKAWVISRPSAEVAAQTIMGMLGGKAQEQQSIFDTCRDIKENKNDKASDTLYGVLAMHNVVTLQKQAGIFDNAHCMDINSMSLKQKLQRLDHDDLIQLMNKFGIHDHSDGELTPYEVIEDCINVGDADAYDIEQACDKILGEYNEISRDENRMKSQMNNSGQGKYFSNNKPVKTAQMHNVVVLQKQAAGSPWTPRTTPHPETSRPMMGHEQPDNIDMPFPGLSSAAPQKPFKCNVCQDAFDRPAFDRQTNSICPSCGSPSIVSTATGAPPPSPGMGTSPMPNRGGTFSTTKTAQSQNGQSRQRNGWVRGMRNKWNRVVDGYNDGTPWRIDRDKMYNFTHYYTDAISFDEDPNRVYSGEALWRAYIMDKYSCEYQDQKTGHLVGGYINDRFYVFPDAGTPANPDVPRDGGNPMSLTLGERSRKPRPHQWSTERRMEDARGNETYDLEATASTKQMVKTAGTITEAKLPTERKDDKIYNILRDTIEMREAGIEYSDMIQKISNHYGASITGVAQIDVEAQRLLQKHEGVMYKMHKIVQSEGARFTDENALYVEETAPDGSYNILWRDGTPEEAMAFLQSCLSTNRLELWSKSHAQTDKGYAPLAYRDANNNKVKVSHNFKLLFLNQTATQDQKKNDKLGRIANVPPGTFETIRDAPVISLKDNADMILPTGTNVVAMQGGNYQIVDGPSAGQQVSLAQGRDAGEFFQQLDNPLEGHVQEAADESGLNEEAQPRNAVATQSNAQPTAPSNAQNATQQNVPTADQGIGFGIDEASQPASQLKQQGI